MPQQTERRLTAREVLSGLTKSLSGVGTKADEWVLIPEARVSAGFGGNDGQADLIAINSWASKGFEVRGYEVKVSRSDWQSEMAHPEKSARFMRWCHSWWLAVPKPHTTVLSLDELPPNWGLIEVSERGARIVKQAPRLTPEPVPWPTVVGWLAQVDRRQKRSTEAERNAIRAEGFQKGREHAEAEHARSRDGRAEESLRKVIAGFREATGIDLLGQHYRPWPRWIGPLLEAMRAYDDPGERISQAAKLAAREAERLEGLAGAIRALPADADPGDLFK